MVLHFYYGTMNSSKTANLIMKAFSLRQQGKRVILIKPELDVRLGKDNTMIYSRAVPTMQADMVISQMMGEIQISDVENVSHVLVDEAQFLSSQNVDALRKLSMDVAVSCYGLRTDYKATLFPGSKRLIEVADSLHEIETVCVACNNKATVSCKFVIDAETNTRHIIHDGVSIPDMGMEEKYAPVCWPCWYKTDILEMK